MYDQFARDYDRFVNWNNRLAFELPMLKKLIREAVKKDSLPFTVLDAACGTGMHALALAKEGFQMTGADLSAEMVAKARENAQKAKLSTRFEQAGFGSLAAKFGGQRFNALLCLGNSLPHLLTGDDLVSALRDFHDCLQPGGVLLIQNRNFDAVLEKKERWMEPQTHQQGNEEWIFQRFYDFQAADRIQFNVVVLHKQGNEEWKSAVLTSTLKAMRKDGLLIHLQEAGFSEIEVFGSLAGEAFSTSASGNLVLFARNA